MNFLNRAFFNFLPAACTVFSDEIEILFANIDERLRKFLQQVDIVHLALPFLRFPEEDKKRLQDSTLAATCQSEDSMSSVRALIPEEGPRFQGILRRLANILNDNFLHAASNLGDREEALRRAKAHLEFL